jgi:hypothetical protein
MSLQEQCLIITIEALIGENRIVSSEAWVDDSLVLSKMKIFHKIKQNKIEMHSNIFKNLQKLFDEKNTYLLLITEILYLLSFKKKFNQKNTNRIINNYFRIISLQSRKKINNIAIPKQIISDDKYILTLALSNLYTISQFYENKKTN